MKKSAAILVVTFLLAACSAEVYSEKGNATILTSQNLSNEVQELTVRRDNGEIVTVTREFDSHAAVGARVNLAEGNDNPTLKTIRRYEFK